jgi:hypothetical protein
MMAKRKPMKPHPFGEELENMVVFIYRKQMMTEAGILRTILGDFFVEGLSPTEIVDGHNAFMASNPSTYSLAYYRAFIRKRVLVHTDTIGVNDAW